MLSAKGFEISIELRAIARFSIVNEMLGAIRIVKIENRSLGKGVGGAAAGRMKRIAVDLMGRPSLVVATSGIAPVRRGIAVA